MSTPPPNHCLSVWRYLELKCIEGIKGEEGWITTLIPVAQYLGLVFVPGILDLILSLKFPETVEIFTPAFSMIFPLKSPIVPPPLPECFHSLYLKL